MTTAKGAFSPIADSLYPYMLRNKNFALIKKILLILMPIIFVGCAILWVVAEPFCVMFLGAEYTASADILRVFIPIILISLPNYIFGFPVLSPLGLSRYANLSVVIGAIVHAIQLLILFTSSAMNAVTVGIATCITEVVILCIRISVVIIHKRKNLNQTN